MIRANYLPTLSYNVKYYQEFGQVVPWRRASRCIRFVNSRLERNLHMFVYIWLKLLLEPSPVIRLVDERSIRVVLLVSPSKLSGLLCNFKMIWLFGNWKVRIGTSNGVPSWVFLYLVVFLELISG